MTKPSGPMLVDRRGFLLGCAGAMLGLCHPICAEEEERHMRTLKGLRAVPIEYFSTGEESRARQWLEED